MGDQDFEASLVRKVAVQTILGPDFSRATFGGPIRGQARHPWVRIVVRPVSIRGQTLWQVSYFDSKKDITKNYSFQDMQSQLDELLAMGFANIHIDTQSENIDIRFGKKGNLDQICRQYRTKPAPPRSAHNRVKDLPLVEGRPNRLLEVMGILTRDGRVKPTRRAKFTQINEFLKQLALVLHEAKLTAGGHPLRLLDCGCGLSFLTLATHQYLNENLNIPAEILGVDVNDEVIRKSVERSHRINTEGVSFLSGSIESAQIKPDIILALHACDTATDDALAFAITTRAKVVLSVPCCHHHLNDQLRPGASAASIKPVLRHGILHQRAADLLTDAFRALILRIMGYRTDVIEFISPEHTARNLMIRAVGGADLGNAALVDEYREMRRFWQATPYLESVLGEPFWQLVGKLN